MDPFLKKVLVEILGTFLLTFVALTTKNYLAIGATLALAIFLGKGTYNPAVALAQFLKNEIPSGHVVAVIVSELVGGGLAYYVSKSY